MLGGVFSRKLFSTTAGLHTSAVLWVLVLVIMILYNANAVNFYSEKNTASVWWVVGCPRQPPPPPQSAASDDHMGATEAEDWLADAGAWADLHSRRHADSWQDDPVSVLYSELLQLLDDIRRAGLFLPT
nr:uncharacterized protein LOC128693130 [Cherax quadricarinatus]